jgi:hypothetical protein
MTLPMCAIWRYPQIDGYADMRRSGVVEAIAGGTDVIVKLICRPSLRTPSAGQTRYKTYAPVEIEAVRKADVARLRDRRKMRAANRKSPKI